MDNEIANLMAMRIAEGLSRKSITCASKWAEKYRVTSSKISPGPWRFKHYPWLKGMHDSEAELNVGQKAAQMGFTECVLNLTFYNIDVKGINCIYILPSKTPDASNFSASRFDSALELSPHLSNLFSDVRNVGHKRAGAANLYIRGSKSRAGLKSNPCGFIVMDEVAEFVEENIPLAMERASGQLEHQIWMISTPTVDTIGISKYFEHSTKDQFFFKCPSCSRHIKLDFPESIVITATDMFDPRVKESYYICSECKATLPHETKCEWLSTGIWVPEISDRDARGFSIGQFYSPTIRPEEMALSYFKGLVNPADEVEFFNSKLGKPHTTEGARVSDADINNCIKGYNNNDTPRSGIITMGIDVGKWIHYEVDLWYMAPGPTANSIDVNLQCHCRVINHGKVRDFEELDSIMRLYNVQSCVIDAGPERRKCLEFANRFYGRTKMCFYGQGVNGKTINIGKDPREPTITVDRTAWLDLSLSRFRNKSIELPIDTLIEYKSNLKALIRTYRKDKNGNAVGDYVKDANSPDHFAHARNYAEIALPFAINMGQSHNISGAF